MIIIPAFVRVKDMIARSRKMKGRLVVHVADDRKQFSELAAFVVDEASTVLQFQENFLLAQGGGRLGMWLIRLEFNEQSK